MEKDSLICIGDRLKCYKHVIKQHGKEERRQRSYVISRFDEIL